jgi:Fe-S cluster biogenesis protein NfuA
MQIKTEHFSARQNLLFYLPNGFYPFGAKIIEKETGYESEFLKILLNIDGVKRCLLTPELLAVAYEQNANPQDIKALVLAEIDDYSETPPSFNITEELPLNRQSLEAISDAFIRPTLYRDGGDIEIIDLKDNILHLRFVGKCSGCPYAQNTLNNVIIKVLKKYLPQIEQVVTEE